MAQSSIHEPPTCIAMDERAEDAMLEAYAIAC